MCIDLYPLERAVQNVLINSFFERFYTMERLEVRDISIWACRFPDNYPVAEGHDTGTASGGYDHF